MSRLRGWGVLLAIGVPLMIFISWSRLGATSSNINLERFENWLTQPTSDFIGPAAQHFSRYKKLAIPGDVTLPAVPKNSGVKSWELQNDATLVVQLDAKVDGRVVQLRYVPIVNGASSVSYDCVSTTSPVVVGKFCRADTIRSVDDIPARLAANEEILKNLPPVVTASGDKLAAGTLMGSVYVMPTKVADGDSCGFSCVKPQSCANARPLACVIVIETSNSRTQEFSPTADNFRGTDMATRSAADKACAQALGSGYKVAVGASMWGQFKLSGGADYWMHNDVSEQNNCWSTDYR
jgi:hypothetical protein